jgi:hypothetical protein
MATGDVRAAVAALITALRSVRFPAADEFDMQSAEAGSPVPLLPALDYLLLHFSTHVVQRLAELGLQVRRRPSLALLVPTFLLVYSQPVALHIACSCMDSATCASWRVPSSLRVVWGCG